MSSGTDWFAMDLQLELEESLDMHFSTASPPHVDGQSPNIYRLRHRNKHLWTMRQDRKAISTFCLTPQPFSDRQPGLRAEASLAQEARDSKGRARGRNLT